MFEDHKITTKCLDLAIGILPISVLKSSNILLKEFLDNLIEISYAKLSVESNDEWQTVYNSGYQN